MRTNKVDLSIYTSKDFDRGASVLKESMWVLVSLMLFRLCPLALSDMKAAVLRAFGARVGKGVVIKPNVRIQFPWRLTIGDHTWLGEEAWLLNLAPVTLGSDVCVSQRAFLCTGNHDYKSPTFDLIVKPIWVESGAWIGAGAWVGPGVRVGSHAVLTAQSVAVRDLEPFQVYRGNPAAAIRPRRIEG